jgi:predicted dehydrogenase
MSLGFAIVGTGMISRFHARAIADTRGAKLVACFNRTTKKAKQFGKEHGCTAYNSLNSPLNKSISYDFKRPGRTQDGRPFSD